MSDLFTTIDLLRHGEAIGGNCYRGSQDDPLSETGWKQMYTALQNELDWDLIVYSPLKRCSAFAIRISAENNIPSQEDHRFKEIHFGDWEGRTASQIEALDPVALKKFWDDPVKNPPPNGEAYKEFQHRVLTGWQDLLNNHLNKRILVIVHAGVIRTILTEVLQMKDAAKFRLHVPHTCLSRIRYYDGNLDFPQLISHGPAV